MSINRNTMVEQAASINAEPIMAPIQEEPVNVQENIPGVPMAPVMQQEQQENVNVNAAPQMLSRSRTAWQHQQKKNEAAFGWLYEQERPLSKKEIKEKLAETHQNTFGKKMSKAEQIKAYREYQNKKKDYERHKEADDAWQNYCDQVDRQFNEEKYRETNGRLREEWNDIKLLDNQQERKQYLDGILGNQPQVVAAQYDIIFKKMEELYADENRMRMFEFSSVDDMFENYTEKMKYIKVGFGLRKKVGQYIDAGGYLSQKRYLKLMEIADTFETLQQSYSVAEQKELSPLNLVLREKHLKTITSENANATIHAISSRNVRKRIPQGASDAEREQITKENDRLNAAKTMEMDFLQKRTTEWIPAWEKTGASGSPGFGPGMSVAELKSSVSAIRIEKEKQRWLEARDSYISSRQRMDDIFSNSLYEKEGDFKLIDDKSICAGRVFGTQKNRKATRKSLVNLIFLYREYAAGNGVTLAKLQESSLTKEQQERRKAVRDDIDAKLLAPGEDIDSMAELMHEAIHGMLEQFKKEKINGRPAFSQFKDVRTMGTTNMKTWAKNMALYNYAKYLMIDLSQLLGANFELLEKATAKLSKADFKLFKEIDQFIGKDIGFAVSPWNVVVDREDFEFLAKGDSEHLLKDQVSSDRDVAIGMFNGINEFLTGMHCGLSKNQDASDGDWVRPSSHISGAMVSLSDETRERMLSSGRVEQELRETQQGIDAETFVAAGGHVIDYSNRPEA